MEDTEKVIDRDRSQPEPVKNHRDLATAGGGSIPASGSPAAENVNNAPSASQPADKRDEGESSETLARKSSGRDEGPNAARRDYKDMSFDPMQAITPHQVKQPDKK